MQQLRLTPEHHGQVAVQGLQGNRARSTTMAGATVRVFKGIELRPPGVGIHNPDHGEEGVVTTVVPSSLEA